MSGIKRIILDEPTYDKNDNTVLTVDAGAFQSFLVVGGPFRFKNLAGFIKYLDQLTELTPEEKKLAQAIDFSGIEVFEPQNLWHMMILIGLLTHKHRDSRAHASEYPNSQSLFSEIIAKLSKHHGNLDHVGYKSLKFGDLGKDIGMRRNVDLIDLTFENGETVQMTGSIDRRSQIMTTEEMYQQPPKQIDPELSPTFREAEALKTLNEAEVSSVQTIYGEINISTMMATTSHKNRQKSEGKIYTKFINFKEFIEGQMLFEYIAEPELVADLIGRDNMKEIAFKTGRAISEVIEKTGKIVCDSHPGNLIVGENNGEIYVRYCDINDLSENPDDIDFEIRTLRERFRSFTADFMRGIDGPSGK